MKTTTPATTPKTTSTLLPLSTLLAANPCDAAERIAAFAIRHGRCPDGAATLAEWVAVTDKVGDLLWGLRFIPAEKARRVAVYVVTRAARRTLHAWAGKGGCVDPRAKSALEAAERWLEDPKKEDADDLRHSGNDAYAATVNSHLLQGSRPYCYVVYYAVSATAALDMESVASLALCGVNEAEMGLHGFTPTSAPVTAERIAQRQDFLDALELYL